MIKVSELSGAPLDYYTGLCDGFARADLKIIEVQRSMVQRCVYKNIQMHDPSASWCIGGPMLSRMLGAGYGIFMVISDTDHISEYCVYQQGLPKHAPAYGDTPLVAACRARVRQMFGEEVEEIEVTR